MIDTSASTALKLRWRLWNFTEATVVIFSWEVQHFSAKPLKELSKKKYQVFQCRDSFEFWMDLSFVTGTLCGLPERERQL